MKTSTERQREFVERKRSAGLVRIVAWVKKEDAERVLELIRKETGDE